MRGFELPKQKGLDMAITDNNFSPDELKAAVAANPALKDIALGYFKESGYVARSAAEEQDYVKQLESQHVAGYVGKTAPLVEKTIEELTGIKKTAPEENWYDLNKRALGSVVEERNNLKTELDTLKKSSNITEAERKQLDSMTEKVKELNKEIEKMKKDGESALNKAKLENRVSKEMSDVLPKLVKDERPGVKKAQDLLSNQIYQEALDIAQEDSRKQIVLIGKDGQPLLNQDGTFKTVAQFYEEKMTEAGFIDDGKTLTGAGGNTPPRPSQIPGGCKTQAELMDWLRDNTMKGKPQSELITEFDKYAHLLPR